MSEQKAEFTAAPWSAELMSEAWGKKGAGWGIARLIAAAPERLQALEEIRKRIKESDCWWMDVPSYGGFEQRPKP